MDLDGDGYVDVLSGSWPGQIYLFRGTGQNQFAAGELLKDKWGKPLDVGHASAAFAVDWDGNGSLDLVVGTVTGEVHLIPNEDAHKGLAFGAGRPLKAAGQPIKVPGDAGPTVADWDGDGLLDLIVGAEDGSVAWFRNGGSARQPKLAAAVQLVAKSPLGWGGDDKRQPSDWGLRVKPCVADWDGDGRLDLLLGDRCGSYLGKATQTEQEQAEERQANDQLPGLRRQWADAFRAYRRLSDLPAVTGTAGRTREMDGLRREMQRLKDEMVVVQEIQSRYQPGHQAHGFVWLFLRKPLTDRSKP